MTISSGVVEAKGGSGVQNDVGGSGGNHPGSAGTTKVTGGNLVADKIQGDVTNGGGDSTFRVTVAGVNFGAKKAVTLTIDGVEWKGITDSKGDFYLYLPELAQGGEVSVTYGGKDYKGTLGVVETDHSSIVMLTLYDVTPPTLTPGSANRTADDKATVTFNINEAGKYYYIAQKKDDPAPDETALLLASPNTCTAGSNTINLTGLDPDEYEIYILGVDEANNKSGILKIDIGEYTTPTPPGPTDPTGASHYTQPKQMAL